VSFLNLSEVRGAIVGRWWGAFGGIEVGGAVRQSQMDLDVREDRGKWKTTDHLNDSTNRQVAPLFRSSYTKSPTNLITKSHSAKSRWAIRQICPTGPNKSNSRPPFFPLEESSRPSYSVEPIPITKEEQMGVCGRNCESLETTQPSPLAVSSE
jgi:hypothetical protein